MLTFGLKIDGVRAYMGAKSPFAKMRIAVYLWEKAGYTVPSCEAVAEYHRA